MPGPVLARNDESDDEMSGFEDDFSVGIDLPMAIETSGNVTPIPTTGELEELRLVSKCVAISNDDDHLQFAVLLMSPP